MAMTALAILAIAVSLVLVVILFLLVLLVVRLGEFNIWAVVIVVSEREADSVERHATNDLSFDFISLVCHDPLIVSIIALEVHSFHSLGLLFAGLVTLVLGLAAGMVPRVRMIALRVLVTLLALSFVSIATTSMVPGVRVLTFTVLFLVLILLELAACFQVLQLGVIGCSALVVISVHGVRLLIVGVFLAEVASSSAFALLALLGLLVALSWAASVVM